MASIAPVPLAEAAVARARATLRAVDAALQHTSGGGGAWLASLDVNPLIVTEAGVVAVDALFVAADEEVEDPRSTT